MFSEVSLTVPGCSSLSAINYSLTVVTGERAVPVANSFGQGWIIFLIQVSLAYDKK